MPRPLPWPVTETDASLSARLSGAVVWSSRLTRWQQSPCDKAEAARTYYLLNHSATARSTSRLRASRARSCTRPCPTVDTAPPRWPRAPHEVRAGLTDAGPWPPKGPRGTPPAARSPFSSCSPSLVAEGVGVRWQLCQKRDATSGRALGGERRAQLGDA